MTRSYVTVVSGMPRSGTSCMMRMLEAGGLPSLTDRRRLADSHNPHGYFEYELVKQLPRDASWIGNGRGKAVKIIYPLLQYLPTEIEYRVLFMERDLREVFASQRAMLLSRGDPAADQDENRLIPVLRTELLGIKEWLAGQSNMQHLYVPYAELTRESAGWSRKISHFLSGGLNEAAMAGAVDPSLRHDWPLQSDF
jgi:hypothetical protein